MTTARPSTTARRLAGAALTSTALFAAALAPQNASAKSHHHVHAKRAAAPTAACTPGDLQMTGQGKEARLWVCRADGTWTEAVYAVTKGGHTSTVNAGRVQP